MLVFDNPRQNTKAQRLEGMKEGRRASGDVLGFRWVLQRMGLGPLGPFRLVLTPLSPLSRVSDDGWPQAQGQRQ